MKFIDSVNIKGDVSEAVVLLRRKGILASNSEDYANTPTASVAAKSIKEGLWVHINSQYNDAIQVLQDRNHVVATRLTPSEMKEIELKAKNSLNLFIQGSINRSLAAVISLLIIGLVGYVLANTIFA